jgi:hypothetical protein
MKTKFIVSFILLLTLAVFNANAQAVRKNARTERARIAQGTRSGELTRVEKARLSKEQREIRKDIRDAKKDDGHISRRERKQIKKDQRKASRHIYRAKHNNRKRAA